MSRVVIVHRQFGIYNCCDSDMAYFTLAENFKSGDVAAVFSSREFAEKLIGDWGLFPNLSEFQFIPVNTKNNVATIVDLRWAGVISPEQFALVERKDSKATVH